MPGILAADVKWLGLGIRTRVCSLKSVRSETGFGFGCVTYRNLDWDYVF